MEHRLLNRSMYPTLRHLDRCERLKTYIPHKGGSYDTAETMIGKYKVEIVDEPEYEQIFIWNPIRPCIFIDLDKRNHYAALNSVEYDQSCTIDGKMKRGSGTKEMIDFALNLLKKRGVKNVQLMDKSKIVCNGKEISLKLMYFLKYGETWYEKNFGFKPEAKYQTKYEEVKKRRLEKLDVELLKNAPCDEFTDDLLDDILVPKTKFSFHGNIVWEKIL